MRQEPIFVMKGTLANKLFGTDASLNTVQKDGITVPGDDGYILFRDSSDDSGIGTSAYLMYDNTDQRLILADMIIAHPTNHSFKLKFLQINAGETDYHDIQITGLATDNRTYTLPDKNMTFAGVDDLLVLPKLVDNTITGLKAEPGTNLPDYHIRIVAGIPYFFDKTSVTAGNDINIIQPTDGIGRYFRITPHAYITESLYNKLLADDTPSDTRKPKLTRGLDAAKGAAALKAGEFYQSSDLNGGTLFWSDGSNWHQQAPGINSTGTGSLIVSRTETNIKAHEAIYTGVAITVTDPLCTGIAFVFVNGIIYNPTTYAISTNNTVTFNSTAEIPANADITILYAWEAAKITVNTTDATVTTLTTIAMNTNNKRFQATMRIVAHTANMAEVYSTTVVFTAKRNNAGTVSIVGTRTKIYEQKDTAGSPDVTVDVSGVDVRIRVTGEAAKSYTWTLEESIIRTN